jgi:spore coat polysaccharide biosynthesis protein SpsF
MPKRVVCIIQARIGSTRLPRKVLLPLLDKPILWWDVYRVRKCRLLDDIVIATTDLIQDDCLADLAQHEGWSVFRGSEHDVLDRYYHAALAYQADVVVRITSDCPLIDPAVVDYVVGAFLSAAPRIDYASNTLARTYPRGLDVEVFTFAALEHAWRVDQSPQREHVTPYMYRNPEYFRLLGVQNRGDYASHRWTVDTSEDYMLVEHIYQQFGHGDCSWQDVLQLLDQHPEWVALNAHIEQKSL